MSKNEGSVELESVSNNQGSAEEINTGNFGSGSGSVGEINTGNFGSGSGSVVENVGDALTSKLGNMNLGAAAAEESAS
jgi:hypothetical protein